MRLGHHVIKRGQELGWEFLLDLCILKKRVGGPHDWIWISSRDIMRHVRDMIEMDGVLEYDDSEDEDSLYMIIQDEIDALLTDMEGSAVLNTMGFDGLEDEDEGVYGS